MDSVQGNSSKYNSYMDDMEPLVTSISSVEKIENIRQQVKQLILNAHDLACGSKIPKKVPKIKPNPSNGQCFTEKKSVVHNQLTKNDSLQNKTTHNTKMSNNTFYTKSTHVYKSNRITNSKESLQSFLPPDSKLTAYNSFIESLTQIIQETKQVTPVSRDDDATLNSQKCPVENKHTFMILNPYVINSAHKIPNYECQDITYEDRSADKTTYCRPVACSQEVLTKTLEKNPKLQKLVKRIKLAREKEKETEAWHNYINELKNKHKNSDVRSGISSRYYKHEISNIIDSSYDIRHTGEQPDFVENITHRCKGSNEILEENHRKRRIWYAPTSNKPYRFTNNSLCFPISSQARFILMKRERSGRNIRTQHHITRKICKGTGASNMNESQSNSIKRSTQYEPEDIMQETRLENITATNSIITNSGVIKDRLSKKIVQASSFAAQVKHSMSQRYLENIEKKLDSLIDSFNAFFRESKSRKDTKSAAVSCSSLARVTDQICKATSDSNSLLSKGNKMICEVAQQITSNMTFPSRSLHESTFDQIMTEEMEKNEKIKKDIDSILNSTGQCAVKITIDVPTKENSTEVTSSLYKTQQLETATEEMKPTGTQVCKPDATMTIAVNTDPLGLLALIRVSAQTVKQILSYVPNLDYVSYLTRRQILSSGPIKRFACNICGLSFSQPSMLNDHIQAHNISHTKNCCVCRFALDRVRHKPSIFACCHCGQTFTRAYCCELHERSCRKTHKPQLSLSCYEPRRTIASEEKILRMNRF